MILGGQSSLRAAGGAERAGARRAFPAAVGARGAAAGCCTTSAGGLLQHGIGAVRELPLRDVRARAADEEVVEGTHWYQKACGPNCIEVNSVQELVEVLATDRLVIVDFFAPWCGACRALFPKMHKLLHEYPEVLLVKVNFEANRAMCKSLGIKVLPFFHFYHGAQGRVAAFSATVSKLQRLRDALELHSGDICSLEEPPGLAEFPDLHAEHPEDATLLGRDGWARSEERVAEAAAAP